MHDEGRDWMPERIRVLAALLEREDYRGWDPFDLSNSPLLGRIPQGWHLPHLVLSKFGSRVAPDALRRLLRVPPIEDPKIYACAYFGYRLSGLPELAERAEPMLDRLASMAQHADGTYWGYDYLWATRGTGVNPRGGSTLVPGSFAALALAHSGRHGEMLVAALDHYATRHRCRGAAGEYLGYFPGATSNTHNANLLGCVALTAGGRALADDRHLEQAAEAAATSVAAIGPDGYIPYSDHATGDWTDCFHHLYVLASVRALAALNPRVPRADFELAAERLERYHREQFERPDGLVNYYPGSIHPVDPHNYAAAAIYLTLTGDAPAARTLLRRVDELMWDERLGRYQHRLHRRRRDKRFFLRWTQVWMFAALCVAHAGDEAQADVERTRMRLLGPVAAT